MKKRVLSMLLAIVMILSMVPMSALTAFATTPDPVVVDEVSIMGATVPLAGQNSQDYLDAEMFRPYIQGHPVYPMFIDFAIWYEGPVTDLMAEEAPIVSGEFVAGQQYSLFLVLGFYDGYEHYTFDPNAVVEVFGADSVVSLTNGDILGVAINFTAVEGRFDEEDLINNVDVTFEIDENTVNGAYYTVPTDNENVIAHIVAYQDLDSEYMERVYADFPYGIYMQLDCKDGYCVPPDATITINGVVYEPDDYWFVDGVPNTIQLDYYIVPTITEIEITGVPTVYAGAPVDMNYEFIYEDILFNPYYVCLDDFYIFEGDLDYLNEYHPDPFEGTFVEGNQYTLVLLVYSEELDFDTSVTAKVFGADSVVVERDEDDADLAAIYVTYTAKAPSAEGISALSFEMPPVGTKLNYGCNIFETDNEDVQAQIVIIDGATEYPAEEIENNHYYYVYGEFVAKNGAWFDEDITLTVNGNTLVAGDDFDNYGAVILFGCEFVTGDPVEITYVSDVDEGTYYDYDFTGRGEEYTLLDNQNSVDGKKFIGWTIEGDDSGTVYPAGSSIVITEDTTFNAVFVDTIEVAGKQLSDGEYLDNELNITTTKPAEGGYAYFKDGVLTLHNFVCDNYSERHNNIINVVGMDLEIVVEGTNTLTQKAAFHAIYAENANLTIRGEGTLNIASVGITQSLVYLEAGELKKFTIQDCTLNLTPAGGSAIFTSKVDVVLNGATLSIENNARCIYLSSGGSFSATDSTLNLVSRSNHGIYVDGDATLKNTDVTIVANSNYGILVYGDLNVDGGTFDISAQRPFVAYDGEIILKNADLDLYAYGYGIYAYNTHITVDNTTLDIELADNTESDYGIYTTADHNLTIKNSDVTVTSWYTCVYINGSVDVNGGSLTLTSTHGYALSVDSISLKNTTVNADSYNTTISIGADITVDNSTLVIDSDSYGLYTSAGTITITNSDVTASCERSCIQSYSGEINISGSDITLNSKNASYGLFAANITLTGTNTTINGLYKNNNSGFMVYASGNITVDGGSLAINNTSGYGISSSTMTVNSGRVTANCYGRACNSALTVNGGTVDLRNQPGGGAALIGAPTLGEGMVAFAATTAEGELSAYDYENSSNYRRVYITTDGSVETVTVSFNANGGSGTMTDVAIVKDNTYTLPSCTFTAPVNKQFKCWSVGGVEKAPGATITVSADTVITAVWQPIPYTVTFKNGGGSGTMAKVTVNAGDTYVLPESTFSAPSSNKTFKCWSVGGVEMAPGATITVTADTTVTAVWTYLYTITFQNGGGTGTMEKSYVAENNTYTLPESTFTAPFGQIFKCWSVGGEEKAAGTTITVTANTQLTAVWQDDPNTFIVSFRHGGGSGTMASVLVEKNGTYTLPECTFTSPNGYNFKVWCVGEEEKLPGDTITVTADIEISASWVQAVREPVNEFVGTSNITAPVYGGEVDVSYNYNWTSSVPASIPYSMADWQKWDGTSWVNYDESVFTDGTYRFMVQFRVDGRPGYYYYLDDSVSITIDGKAWTYTGTSYVGSNYSYGYAYSPEYVVERGELPLEFVDNDKFDIGINYIDRAITSYSVAGSVVGGTEPYTFSKVSGPAWITVSADGTVSGTPAAAGENADLVIRVTDDKGATSDITIKVGKTYINPADRTPVSSFVGTSNMEAPTLGGSVKKNYTYTWTSSVPASIPSSMASWQKWDGTKWTNYNESTFTEGRYRLSVQFRVDGEYGYTHYLADEATVTIDGKAWNYSGNPTVQDTYSYTYITSPSFNVGITENDLYVGFAPNGGGTGTMENIMVQKGDSYTLPACGFTANSDKRFKCWSVGGVEMAPGTTITVNEDTVVTAIWNQLYSVTLSGTNCTVEGPEKAEQNNNYVCTITVPEGYKITSLIVKRGGTYVLTKDEDYSFDGKTLTINAEKITGYYQVWATASKYSVKISGANLRHDGDDHVEVDTDYVVTLVPVSGYQIDENDIEVLVNGTPVTGWTYVEATGVLTIPYALQTSDVQINVDADRLYHVLFASSGGNCTGTMENLTVQTGTVITLPTPTYVPATGYVFNDWWVNGASYQPGDTITVTGNVNVTARYILDDDTLFDITIENGKASIGGNEVTQSIYYKTINIAANTIPGKVFSHWEVVKGNVTLNRPNERATWFYMPYEDVEIRAVYVNASAAFAGAITFDNVNEGYARPAQKAIAFTNNGQAILNSPRITIISGSEYFELKTYSVPAQLAIGATNDTSYAIQPKAGLTRGVYTAVIQLNAYELAEPITMTVTITVGETLFSVSFDANGGSGTMESVAHDPIVTGQYTVPACTFTAPKGKVFSHWTLNSVTVHPGDKVTISANSTLKAVWKDETTTEFNIVINNGDASVDDTPVTKATQNTVVEIVAATIPGKTFSHWQVVSGDVDIENINYRATWFEMPFEDVEITAVYTTTVYDVVFAGENFTHNGAAVVEHGNNYVVKLTPADGYQIDVQDIVVQVNYGGIYGWSFDAATGTLTIPSGYITGRIDISVSADKLHTVTFSNSGQGTGTIESVIVEDGKKLTLPACTFTPNSGLKFREWRIGFGTNFAKPGDEITITEDTTIYAIFVTDIDTKFNITVQNGTATGIVDTVVTPITQAAQNATVTIKANAIPGKVFSHWEVVSENVTLNNANSATTWFNMPYEAVEVRAVYKTVSAEFATITFENVLEGYARPAGKTALVYNTGDAVLNNPEVTIISGSEYFDLVYSGPANVVPVGGTHTSKYIQPKAGLNKGTYTAVLQFTADELPEPITTTVTFTVGVPGGATVSGTVTSFNDATSDVTIELYREGEATAAFSTVVKGNSASYSIEGVDTGVYTVKISKANHVTREYTITVGSENVTQDAKIHLVGDITGDGEITSKDKKLLYNHLNDPSKALEGYEYDVADASGEGDITSKDKKLLYNHINDPSKRLW